jgi:hypothetical protein
MSDEAENKFVGRGDPFRVVPPDADANAGALLELAGKLAAGEITREQYDDAAANLAPPEKAPDE